MLLELDENFETDVIRDSIAWFKIEKTNFDILNSKWNEHSTLNLEFCLKNKSREVFVLRAFQAQLGTSSGESGVKLNRESTIRGKSQQYSKMRSNVKQQKTSATGVK